MERRLFLKGAPVESFLGGRPLKCAQATRASEDKMLWKDREGSSNVEDRRGEGGGFGAAVRDSLCREASWD